MVAVDDNVAVAGYGLYRAGSSVATTTATTASLSGLSCGTAYSLAVDSFDAAGNRSPKAALSVTTAGCSPPPTGGADWSSNLKTGDVVTRGTVWKVTVTPTPDSVDFWASGRMIGTDRSAPFDVPLDIAAGDHKIGFCHRKDGEQKCETTEPGTGIVARITVDDSSTTPVDTTPPSAPGSLRVASATATSVTLAWAAATDATGVSGYTLYRGSSNVGTTTQTSATISGLTCGTAYTLGVDAFDAAGNQSAASTVSASTQACAPTADTAAPSVPASLRVVSATSTSVNIAWTASTDDKGVVGYGLYRGTSSTGTATQTSAGFTGLACGTGYQVGVDAVDAAGNRSARATLTVTTSACADTQAPTVPANVLAGTRTATSVALSWSPSTDNVGIAGYGVYRAGTQVSTTTGTTGIVSGLTCGTNYTLAVDAFDAAGNRSSQAAVLVATTACTDTQAPSTPNGLKASNVTQTGMTATWTASTDNVGVTGYDVYRNGTKLGSSTSPTYAITGLTCNTGYTIGVVAYDAAGNRSTQGQLVLSTSACAPTTGGIVSLSPSGSDSSCSRGGTACKTWERAYAIAQAGDTVSVAGGSYPGATLSGSKQLTFRVASGQTASMTGMLVFQSASNLTVYGPLNTSPGYDSGAIYSMRTTDCTSNLELHDVSGRTFDITESSRNVRLYGGTWGGYTDSPHSSDSAVGGSYGYPGWTGCGDGWVRDVLFDGVTWKDVQYVAASQWGGAHPDCLESHGAFTNITIRNSRFERCGNTFIGTYLDWGSFNGLVIENNTFFQTTNNTYYGMQLGYKPGYTCANLVFRNNSYDPNAPNASNPQAPPLIDDCAATGTGSTTQVYGNTFRAGPGGCAGNWHDNVFGPWAPAAAPESPTDRDKRAHAPTVARPPASRGCRVALAPSPRSPGRSWCPTGRSRSGQVPRGSSAGTPGCSADREGTRARQGRRNGAHDAARPHRSPIASPPLAARARFGTTRELQDTWACTPCSGSSGPDRPISPTGPRVRRAFGGA